MNFTTSVKRLGEGHVISFLLLVCSWGQEPRSPLSPHLKTIALNNICRSAADHVVLDGEG